MPTLGQIAKASISYYNTVRSFSHDSRMYLITSALFGFAIFGGIYTTLLNLYLLRLGYGPQEAGQINGWGQLAFGVVALPVGLIGRYWGSRRMLIAGLSLITLGVGTLSLAQLSPIGLMPWLVTGQILVQVGIATYFVNGGPFIATVSAPAKRNHIFAVNAAIWPLTGFLGSLAGGFLPGTFAVWLGDSLAAPAPYQYALLVAAVLMVLAVLAMLNTHTHDVPTRDSFAKKDPLPVGIFAIMFLTVLLRVIGEGVVRTFFNIYLDAGLQLPVAQIGVLMSAGQLLAVPTALLMPLLAIRMGINSTYIYSTLGMGLSLLPMAFMPGWGTAAIGYVGVIGLLSIARPAIVAIQMESVSPGWRTMLAGTTSAAVGLGWAIASFAGGFLITSFGYSGIFLGGAAVTVAGALVYWLYLRRSI